MKMETKSYIKFVAEEHPALAHQLTEKNKEVGKRRYNLAGLFSHLVCERLGVNCDIILESATTEEIESYFAEKLTAQKTTSKDRWIETLRTASDEEKLNVLRELCQKLGVTSPILV